MNYIEILVFYTVFLSSDAAIFCCLFCADAIRGWRLISLAFNFLGKLESYQRRLDEAHTSNTVTTVRHCQ